MIRYEVKNANNNDLLRNRIMDQTEKLKDDNKFLSNLEYVDSYINPNTRTTQLYKKMTMWFLYYIHLTIIYKNKLN